MHLTQVASMERNPKRPGRHLPPLPAEVGSQRCVAPKATEEREADKEGTQQREDGDGEGDGEGKGKAGEGGGGVTLDIHLELDSDNNNNRSKSID